MNSRSTRQERIDWMLAHEELWRGWTQLSECNRVRNVVMVMQADGLLSKNTRWTDVDVHGLVVAARKQRRNQGLLTATGAAAIPSSASGVA